MEMPILPMRVSCQMCEVGLGDVMLNSRVMVVAEMTAGKRPNRDHILKPITAHTLIYDGTFVGVWGRFQRYLNDPTGSLTFLLCHGRGISLIY